LLALGLLVLAPVFAKKTDRQQQMQVDAKHFDGFQKPNSVSTLTGSVVITQGSLKASGAQAKVYFDANSQINRVVITGAPAHIEQLDDNGNLMQGEAAGIDYQVDKDFAVLTGHASIKQEGRGEAHGDKLTYNTQTSEMTGESGGDGRVHMIFQPKPKAASASAPTQTPIAPTPAHAASAPPAFPVPDATVPAPSASTQQP
jgi:lipopolysaccharide export system protein LptA